LSIDAELRHDLGYATGTLIFAALFVVAVTAQIRAKRFVIPAQAGIQSWRSNRTSPGEASRLDPRLRGDDGWVRRRRADPCARRIQYRNNFLKDYTQACSP
jgi:hypothetical protein